ncbi:MAG TPA: serine hydrolase domain-containing protein [Bryobacteraceae bacterium]|jgi:CubicO group peptidase (beta-lactamase class C family)
MRYQSGLLAVTLCGLACGADRTAQLEALLAPFGSSDPSVSIAVIQDGKPLVISRGLSNLETHTQATSATNYRLASMTKEFTATAILLLAQDGKLRLDQTLDQLFPQFPAYAKSITIRQLLTHTGGLWDYEELIPPSQKIAFKDAEAVQFSSTHATPYFPPGSKFQYSNTGYAALAEIVRITSGMRFATFLKTRIFDPLGMTGTVAHEEGLDTVRNRAYGYTGRTRTDQNITSSVLGDGGIYTSIDDLIKWNAALDSGRLLPRAVLDEATTAGKLTTGEPLNYGYGWFVDPYHGHRRHWHTGETIGFRTAIQRFPDQKLTIIVLSNRGALDAKKLSLDIADLYLQ